MRTSLFRNSVIVAVAALFAFAAWAQQFGDARSLVNRAQNDLQAVPAPHSGKEGERVRNAQRSLSDFDRSLSKGKFDKGRLDSAINDIKNVVDHNTLAPPDRDRLNADLRDLRALRSMHD